VNKKKSHIQHLRNTFIPHHENDGHPHLFREEVVLVVFAFVILIEIIGLTGPFLIGHSGRELGEVLPAVLEDLTNTARVEDNLPDLTVSPVLTEGAQDKANDMAAKGYFSHITPSGQLPWYWFKLVGYNYEYAGENLAVNFTDSQALMTAWLNSPAHRANILGANYTQIGMGMATGTYQGQSAIFVVQFFGTPESAVSSSTSIPAEPVVTQASSLSSDTEAISATTPVETVASSSTAIEPAVLGAETSTIETSPQAQKVSLWDLIISSPHTYLSYALIVLAAFFIIMLILSALPFFSRRLHSNAKFNGLSLVIIIMAFLIVNQNIFFSSLTVASNTQDSSSANILSGADSLTS